MRTAESARHVLSVRPTFFTLGLALLTTWLGAAACTAQLSSPDAHAQPADSTAGAGGAATASAGSAGVSQAPECAKDASLAPARIWRLTDAEYVNAVQKIFGVSLPAEVTATAINTGDYTNFSELTVVNAGSVFAYQTAARQAAAQAVASHLSAFLPCGTGDPCVAQFIQNRIARAFGRPLEATEAQDLLALYHVGAAESPGAGVRLVIEAALQSPSFLYRSELGPATPGGANAKVSLTPHELAAALSYALLDSIPDDALWQKAVDGSLSKPSVLAGEVERLLALPEVQQNLAHMAGYWLGVERLVGTEKSLQAFPEFTERFKADLYRSAQLFVRDVLGTGHVSDLLTSKRLYLNQDLAKVYGVSGVTGTALVAVDAAAGERSGILTQPAVLAAFSRPDRGDPIHRGLFIYNALACGLSIGPPPASAAAVAASFPADATERQLTELRAGNPVCRTCHSFFDPLGLTTERYDPIGRYHASGAAGPIDASSTIKGLGADLDGPVSGLGDLIVRLQVGRRVSDCAVTNLSVFMLGKSDSEKSCALQNVKDQFSKTGSFKDFYRALLTSPGFATRDAAASMPAP